MSILDTIRENPRYSPSNSVQWFMANINKMAKDTNLGPQKVLGQNQHYQTNNIMPGGLYFFMYDAKYKDTLPYWDSFPLVLPFNKTADHFWGLNLHYLPYGARLTLLDALMGFAKVKSNNRLQVSWKMLNNASRFPEVQPSVKQYLRSHVKSMFVEVPMEAWAIAAMLPVQRFKNGTVQQAHRDSRSHISRHRQIGIL